MGGGGGRAEFQRVRQDARQHQPLDPFWHLGRVRSHQVMHDGRGAGQGAHSDVDRAFGFQPADQFVVIDDRRDIQGVDVGGQFLRVVGVNDHHRRAIGKFGHDARLWAVPMLDHKGGFGVGFAQKNRFGLLAADFVQIPSPDDRRSGGIGVGGFVAENLDGHVDAL